MFLSGDVIVCNILIFSNEEKVKLNVYVRKWVSLGCIHFLIRNKIEGSDNTSHQYRHNIFNTVI